MGANRLRVFYFSCIVVAVPIMVLARPTTTKHFGQAAPLGQTSSMTDVEFFAQHVLPVLEANCFKCHGGADKVRGGLSLVTVAGLKKGGESGAVIDLQKPEESLLLKAINHQDGLQMPPRPAPQLAAKDLEVLTRWIKSGAKGFDDKLVAAAIKRSPAGVEKARSYWAYQPVQRSPMPSVKNKSWVRNEIDTFILAKLEAKGLTPAPEADRHTLIRRVYYDLIGLPPTPDEVDAFVNDKNPNAHEALVDKLLASPHYGEKWARHWLDLVRFAETNGFEFDQDKPQIWRYRDYVIDSFNTDKPYDEFVREQIAGDMFSNATPESMIATGYYRLNQWDTGAADRVLQKYEALDSILSTTSQVFLGMSMGCARCHDHKADPILHRDYYSFLAFFQNLQDLGASKTKVILAPIVGRNEAKLLKEKRDRELDLAKQIAQLEQKFAKAIAAKKGLKVAELRSADIIELNYRYYCDTWEKLPDFEVIQTEAEGPITHGYVTLAPAARTEAIGFVFEGKLKVLQDGEYTFHLESTEGARLIIDGKTVLNRPGKGKHVSSEKVKLKAGLLPMRLEYFNSYDTPLLKLAWSGPGVNRRSLSDDQPEKEKHNIATLIAKYGAEALDDKQAKQYAKLVKDFDQSSRLPPGQVGLEISCVSETGSAPTYVFLRGNPQAKSDRVDAAFPSVLVSEKSGAGRGSPDPAPQAVQGGRLALANWLADAKNPLPARVMVNRLWQHHFGRGIVPSPNDFGKQGEQPTHPELLDWLASEFVAKGWKMKEMHRLMMNSSTYRMSSNASEKSMAADPSNLLFWRYNMRRLTAEEVRDSMLSVSGKLNLKMGGPSVYPPIPREVLAGQARPGQGWKVSSPEEASRRSVYVFTKRSLLVPILAQFDQADTDASCPVRFTTTVPTQALGLLNDQFSNDHAKLFVERLKKELPDSLEQQVARAIRLTTGRVPTKAEVTRDLAFIREMLDRSHLSEADAMRFYCLLVLNTNEFLYLD